MQEEINKEFEEKKTELQPKVLEIYVASSAEIKVHNHNKNTIIIIVIIFINFTNSKLTGPS